MRALAWNFPNDPSLAAADRQFFLGDSILVTPVLDQGATSVNGVFPGIMDGSEVYYDWYSKFPVAKPATANSTIAAPLGNGFQSPPSSIVDAIADFTQVTYRSTFEVGQSLLPNSPP